MLRQMEWRCLIRLHLQPRFCCFFNDTATTEIYTLSLHDALPIWMAGLVAGVLFAIFHGIDGGAMATEREEVITVLLLVGYAFQFLAVRKSRAILMLPFALSVGMAMIIKPTAALFAVVLLLLTWFVLRRRAQSPTPYLLFSVAGFAIIVAVLLSFLLPQSLGPFLFLERQAIPFYSSFAPATWGYLLKNSLPAPFLFFLPAAVLLAIANRARANWEIWAIRAGVVLGALSYFVQRKGYTYHRYSFLAFALLWFGLECAIAIKAKGWLRNLGVLGIAVAVLVVLPPRVNRLRHERHNGNPLADQLQVDLQRLGGSSLQTACNAWTWSRVATARSTASAWCKVRGSWATLCSFRPTTATSFLILAGSSGTTCTDRK